MKKVKVILVIALLACLLTVLPQPVLAASNPYPTSQTVGGVVTIPCTYYAWEQAYERLGIVLPAWGNAINWYDAAANAGYAVGTTPKANSIAVWSIDTHSYGHVAFVTSVNGSQMTINEGGRTDAVDNQGIVNGQVLPSTANSYWYGRTLIGFIYLDGEAPKLSVSWAENAEKHSVGSTNAVLAGIGNMTGADISVVSKVGIYLYDYKGTQLAHKTESVDFGNYSYFEIWYDVNDELGYTLSAGTPYKYKFVAIIGETTYESPVYTFATTGTHSHKYDSGKVTASPTCGKEGTKVYTCTTCGGTKTESIAKLTSHSYNSGAVTKQPTCKETGVKTYTCTVCGATKTETIAKLTTHSYNSGAVTKQPTCKETGVKTYTCTVCGATKTETITKLTTHSYNNGAVTKQPTCKETGVKTYTCTVCGVSYTEEIAKLTTHSYDNGVETKAPTCKETGVKTYTCTVCGATKTETIAKLTTHSYNNGAVTKQPTCKETGVKTYTCTVCGDSYTEEIAKLTTHSYDNGVETKAPTCKETGVKTYTCTVCGNSYAEEIAKLTEHSYENGTCAVCGSSDPDYVPPTEPAEPTTTEPVPDDPTEPAIDSIEPEDQEEAGGFFAAIAAFFETIFRILFWFMYL